MMRKLIKMSVVFAAAVTILSLGAFNRAAWAREVPINETTFPDQVFRNYILEVKDDGDAILSDEELSSIDEIDVSMEDEEREEEDKNVISNLKGIEYFKELEVLDCSGNDLTTLDLSANKKLKHLDCYNNTLTLLKLPENGVLNYLDCYDNKLTSLNLSKNTGLEYLNCNDNSITSLDLKNNIALTELSCMDNKLTSLDVSMLTELKRLECGNYNNIFYEGEDPEINESGNYNCIDSLDLTRNQKLETLVCMALGLSELDISGLTQLIKVNCRDNDLTSLDLNTNKKLMSVNCGNNKLTSLNVGMLPELSNLNCGNFSEENIVTGNYNRITSIDLSRNKKLEELNCADNRLTSLDTGNTVLESLVCYDNELSSLNMSKTTNLIKLDCTNNKLSEIDLSKNTELEYLYCADNLLSKLDLSNNKNLIFLDCSNNALTELELKNNTRIAELFCYGNQIKKLDVSSLIEILKLDCYDNGMEKLTLGDPSSPRVQTNTSWTLNCGNNNLTELELITVPDVVNLYCDHNKLTSLDLSKLNHLEKLLCDHNALTSLDLSKNLYLSYTTCSHNSIKKLELRKVNKPEYWDDEGNGEYGEDFGEDEGGDDNSGDSEIDVEMGLYDAVFDEDEEDLGGEEEDDIPELPYIDCSFNELETLDISFMDELEVLNCFRNKYLTSLDVTKNLVLQGIYANGNAFDSVNVTGLNIVNTDGTLSADKKSISFKKYDPDDPMFDDPENPGDISPKRAAEKAAGENKGSVNDTVTLESSGKKFILNYETAPLKEAVITVAKGNSFTITGSLKDFKSDSSNVKVNKKGLVKAKKATGETPAVITFASASDDSGYTLKVFVIDPAEGAEALSGNAEIKKMKINASKSDTIQEISMKGVPLNAEVGEIADKKEAAKPLTGRKSIFEIGSDGFFHLAAELTGNKGKIKIPLKVNGKKFNYTMKIK